jgi:uncharacterized damage-inducible protein DinB
MTSTIGYFSELARNNAWSNYRLLKACAQLTQSAFTAPRTSFFPSIQMTLNHILTVEWFYLDALESGGRGRSVYDDEIACPTAKELITAQGLADQRLITFCDALTEAQLSNPVKLLRDDGRTYIDRTDRVLTHLFVHQIHHRGQVHAMLSGTTVEPPQLDEFLLATDAPLRAADLQELGIDESDMWRN